MSKKKHKKAQVVGLYSREVVSKPSALLIHANVELEKKPKGFVVFTVKKDGEIDTHLFGSKISRYDLAWMGSFALKLAQHGWQDE